MTRYSRILLRLVIFNVATVPSETVKENVPMVMRKSYELDAKVLS